MLTCPGQFPLFMKMVRSFTIKRIINTYNSKDLKFTDLQGHMHYWSPLRAGLKHSVYN